jgi:hypothetical protein
MNTIQKIPLETYIKQKAAEAKMKLCSTIISKIILWEKGQYKGVEGKLFVSANADYVLFKSMINSTGIKFIGIDSQTNEKKALVNLSNYTVEQQEIRLSLDELTK